MELDESAEGQGQKWVKAAIPGDPLSSSRAKRRRSPQHCMLVFVAKCHQQTCTAAQTGAFL